MKDLSISARQTGMLVVLLILANSILVTPSVIFAEVGADGFWLVLLLSIIDLLVLGAFFMLKSRFPEDKFYDILSKYLGKVLAKLIFSLILLFFLIKSLFTFSVVYTYLRQLVYQDAFEALAVICILPVVNHAVLVGLRSLSRTIELFFYCIIFGILLCIGMSFTNVFGSPIFFQTSVAKFFTSSFRHLVSFGNYLFLFLIMDKISLKEGEGRKIFYFALAGVAIVLAVLYRFYSIFRITAFMHNNALADISMVSAEYSSLGKLDIISMLTIMFLTFFQIELFVYGFCNSFLTIFPKFNKVHAVVAYDLLFLVLQLLLLSQYDFFIGATETYLPYVVIVINYIVPLVLTAITINHKCNYKKIF